MCDKNSVKAKVVDGLITCRKGKGDMRAVTLEKTTQSSTAYNLASTQPEGFQPSAVRVDPKTKLPFCPRGLAVAPMINGKVSCAVRRHRSVRRTRRSATPLQPNSPCQCMNQCQQQCPCRTNTSTCAGMSQAVQQALLNEVKRVNQRIDQEMQRLNKEGRSTGESGREDLLHSKIASGLKKEEDALKGEKVGIQDTLNRSEEAKAMQRKFAQQSIRALRNNFVHTAKLAAARAAKLKSLATANLTRQGSGSGDEKLNVARRSFCGRRCAQGRSGKHCRQAQQALGCICYRKCTQGAAGASCRIFQAEALCICRKQCRSSRCSQAQRAAGCKLPGEALALKDEVCYQRCPSCSKSLAESKAAMAGCKIRRLSCVQAKTRNFCFVKRVCSRKCLRHRPGRRCRFMKKLAKCYMYTGKKPNGKIGGGSDQVITPKEMKILRTLKKCSKKCREDVQGAECRAIRLGACKKARTHVARIAKLVDWRSNVAYRTDDISQYWWKNRKRPRTALVGKNRDLFKTTTSINRSSSSKFRSYYRMERLLLTLGSKRFGRMFTNLKALMAYLATQTK